MFEVDRWWCHEHGWVERDHGTITCNCSCLWIPGVSVEKIKDEEREAILQHITAIGAEHVGKRKWNLILDDLAQFIQSRGQQLEESGDGGYKMSGKRYRAFGHWIFDGEEAMDCKETAQRLNEQAAEIKRLKADMNTKYWDKVRDENTVLRRQLAEAYERALDAACVGEERILKKVPMGSTEEGWAEEMGIAIKLEIKALIPAQEDSNARG